MKAIPSKKELIDYDSKIHYYLVQRGQLPAIQIGGRRRIKRASLDKHILKEDKAGRPRSL
jgi:hypothetical protein